MIDRGVELFLLSNHGKKRGRRFSSILRCPSRRKKVQALLRIREKSSIGEETTPRTFSSREKGKGEETNAF